VTIDEILRRIVRGHANTILLCVLIPLLAVLLVELRTPPAYSAQVRLQTLSSAPGSSTEADGLSSRVLALATTPQVVQSALREARQPASSKDALYASTHKITAERLGESSVVVLSVLGQDPRAAADTVSVLASQIVRFMNEGSRGQFDATLSDVQTQTAAALRERDRLQAQLVHTDGLQARANVQSLLAGAQQDLDHLRDELSSLTVSDVSRDQVVAIDAARPTVDRVPSRVLPRTALAWLLGLLVGIALAVVQETLRPRIAGNRVLARALDAPILGSTGQPRALAGSLNLAARRQGVETVVLVGVDERDEKLARQLLESLRSESQEVALSESLSSAHQPGSSSIGASTDGPTRHRGVGQEQIVTMSSQVRFTDRYGVTPAEEPTAGVVVVSAGTARRSNLEHVEDMIRAMRWPVVGVVEGAPRRGWLARP
jgi:hypothetical protein